MATTREQVAAQLRSQLEMQVRGWESEVARLKALDVPARIAELEGLIAEFKSGKDLILTIPAPLPPPVSVKPPDVVPPDIRLVDAVPSPAPVTRG